MLVVLLYACFSVVGLLLAAIFPPAHPYIGSTTVLPDKAEQSAALNGGVLHRSMERCTSDTWEVLALVLHRSMERCTSDTCGVLYKDKERCIYHM